jgi:hypothetical protein
MIIEQTNSEEIVEASGGLIMAGLCRIKDYKIFFRCAPKKRKETGLVKI